MTYKEAKDILRVAAAEVEWNCPLDYTEAFMKAEEALDKQIPERPVVLNKKGSKHFYCVACGMRLVSEINGELLAGRKTRFCPNCGQTIDWRKNYGKT